LRVSAISVNSIKSQVQNMWGVGQVDMNNVAY